MKKYKFSNAIFLLGFALFVSNAYAASGFLVTNANVTTIKSGDAGQFSVVTQNGSGTCTGQGITFYWSNQQSDQVMARAFANLQVAFATGKKVDIWGSDTASCSSAFSVDVNY